MLDCKFCGETGFEWRETPKGWRLFKDDAAHACRTIAVGPTAEDRVEAARLAALGYRRTSRRHGIVSRVDRPDWKEHMDKLENPKSCPRRFWVLTSDRDADFYRRVHTKDKREVSRNIALLVPASNGDDTGFVPWGALPTHAEASDDAAEVLRFFFIDEPLSPEDRAQMEARCNRVPIAWDFEKTLPCGTVLRKKGSLSMISSPLRDDGPLSSIDQPKEQP